jgi:hypothetical protein
MERREVGRLSTGMEAWHGEEGGGKVVNRDGGVVWRGGEGRQQDRGRCGEKGVRRSSTGFWFLNNEAKAIELFKYFE